jgi:hypothetical protein
MNTNVGFFGSSTATQLSCPPYLRHGGAVRVVHSVNFQAQPARRLGQHGGWSAVRGTEAAAAASRSDTSSSTGSDTELDEAAAFANNIWEPVPPTPALGRKRKVALLLGCAMLEVTLTG